MKKLIPAIVMLLVSAIALSTASYAWFTEGKSVTASGMQVEAQAPASIKISGEFDGNYTGYASSVSFSSVEAKIVAPTSSIDGRTFYTPKASGADGAIEYASSISADTAGNFVSFNLKMKNESAEEVKVALASVLDKVAVANAFSDTIRVAILVDEQTTTVTSIDEATGAATTATKTVEKNQWVFVKDSYTPTYVIVPGVDGNGNVSYDTALTGEGVVAAQPAKGPLKAASEADATGAAWQATAIGDDTFEPASKTEAIFTLGSQEELKFTVVIWFEGQDANCLSTYAGTSANISLEFEIVD